MLFTQGMARIPLEDNYDDVIGKAQRGWKITDADLARRAGVSPDELRALKSGTPDDGVLRRVARHLRLSPSALEDLAHKRWYPQQPMFPRGFAAFNTPYEGMTVNSYLIWDPRDRIAAAFDTGANAQSMLDLIHAGKLTLRYIFLTHTHEDHVADLPRLAKETGAEVWASELEPAPLQGAQ
ncbi:MAG: MBL fold metallo-hydrolase, partial [Opitutus sp.]